MDSFGNVGAVGVSEKQTNKKHWNTDNNFINKYLYTAGKKKKKTPFNVFLLSDFETINTSESLRPSTDIFVYGMWFFSLVEEEARKYHLNISFQIK